VPVPYRHSRNVVTAGLNVSPGVPCHHILRLSIVLADAKQLAAQAARPETAQTDAVAALPSGSAISLRPPAMILKLLQFQRSGKIATARGVYSGLPIRYLLQAVNPSAGWLRGSAPLLADMDNHNIGGRPGQIKHRCPGAAKWTARIWEKLKTAARRAEGFSSPPGRARLVIGGSCPGSVDFPLGGLALSVVRHSGKEVLCASLFHALQET